ncbi:MAG TPA: hypothetical protein VFE78_20030 [Gemmataceae bacterium]|nr:hypothetical protein [Gemmataceae bacterium]
MGDFRVVAVARWGINLEGTSYGYIGNNISFNWTGACISLNGANEHFNIVERNLMAVCVGPAGRGDGRGVNDLAWEGNGLWWNSANNRIRDNVVTPQWAAPARSAPHAQTITAILGGLSPSR